MKRLLCLSALAVGLFAATPQTEALGQLLSIGLGGVQYDGYGQGYYGQGFYGGYGPRYREYGPAVRTYSGYGYGPYGSGSGSGYAYNGGYRPFGWGVGPWGRGATVYNSGYLGYSNPYYNDSYGAYGNYNYSQPIPVVSSAVVVAGGNTSCQQSLDDGIQAFKQNDYDAALDIVNKGLVTCPGDSAMHEFRALVLFAKGDYQQAASTMHSVLAVGPGWNWDTLSSLYPDVSAYTAQLRALEAFSKAHPQDGAALFLLGYHYMADGYPDSAARVLQKVVNLVPADRVAKNVLRIVAKSPVDLPTDAGLQPATLPPRTIIPATTINSGMFAGIWLASRDDGSKFELILKNDASFNWKFTFKQTVQEFGGTYKVDGNVVTLQRSDGGSLIAIVTTDGAQKFNFRLQGAPKEDPGLNFSK